VRPPRAAVLTVAVLGPALGASAAAAALGAAAEHLGAAVPLPAAAGLGAGLGLIAAPPVRLALERRSAGAGGLVSLLVSCLCLGGMLAVLGLSALVPASATTAAVYAVLVQPTGRRLAECCAVVAVTSTAALGAQALGWVDGVVSTPVAALLSVALLLLTTPTVANSFDVSRRAERAAAALEAERRQHVRELEHAALRDTLTGLLGRRGLAEPLQRAARAAAPGALTGVLFVDLDGFKPVNDVHGHAAGDELLVVLARRLEACGRAGDAVARIGGDEFVLVLPGLPRAASAQEVARRVSHEVSREVVLQDGSRVRVGASIGVVTTARPRGADELLTAADSAMYRVKAAGRHDRRPVREAL